MKILLHHHHDGELQRSHVEDNNREYIRLAKSFDPVFGTLSDCKEPLWFNKNGTLVIALHSRVLEARFVNELIRLNVGTPGVNVTHHAPVEDFRVPACLQRKDGDEDGEPF